ncbi:GIY-YIG nuclease family protein [Asticcacaulis taihuensis]|uniref:GIY-YIG nuclease family protein n=1 Tax=Asticcacaulis taihuensis TaxID=260084 RepID=UPI003F7BCE6E
MTGHITFNDLLRSQGIDPSDVIVMRHRPYEPDLNRVFAWLASEHHDLFTAYQSAHFVKAESALKKAKYLAAFVGQEPGKALFVCLYQIEGFNQISHETYWAIPENQELKAKGMTGWTDIVGRPSTAWFDLRTLDFFANWKGKLVTKWPGLERSWYRWADRNEFEIHSIAEETLLIKEMEPWDRCVFSWQELLSLPARWRNELSVWKGIYYIFDTLSGKGYVGSAGGEQNILGRWLSYAKTGHGGNKGLKDRNPDNFRFSVLQRLPDISLEEVVAFENAWKLRLHSRQPYGLNEN